MGSVLRLIALWLVGLDGAVPALARGSPAAMAMTAIRPGSPTHFAEPSMRHRLSPSHWDNHGHKFHSQHRMRSQGTQPVVTWPYAPYVEAVPMTTAATGREAPPDPQVIVVPSNPQQQPTVVQESRLDFGYIAGCQAIPKGYLCDNAEPHGQP